MINALSLLGATADVVSRSLVDELLLLEEIEGVSFGIARRSGFSCAFDDDGHVNSVFLRGPGNEPYAEYSGEAPHGITFDLPRDEVRSILGKPSVAGRPKHGHSGHLPHPWDRYDLGDATMHLEYQADEQAIVPITLMTPAAVPDVNPEVREDV